MTAIRLFQFKKQILTVLIFALAVSFLARYYGYLISQPYLNGADAYYYALQVRFFVEDGAFKIPDSSPLLYLMGLTGKLGVAYPATITLWTLLIQLLGGIAVWTASRLIQGKVSFSPVRNSVFAWFILSPVLAFTCIEFPKYAFAAVFLPLWPVGLVNKRFWWVSLLAVLAGSFCHMTMIGLLLLCLAGSALRVIFRRGFIRSKPGLIIMLAVFSVSILGLIGFNNLIFSNLKRIQFQNLQPIWLTFFTRNGIPAPLKIEVGLSLLLSVILLILSIKRDGPAKKVLSFWSPFILFILFIPLGSNEIMGIPERLCLLIPVIAGTSLLAFRLESPFRLQELSMVAAAVLVFAAALFPGFYLKWVHPARLNPDFPLYHRVTQSIAGKDIPMLIAHQGLNYYYKFQTKRESFPYEPESHWPKTKIWRIVYGVTPSQWAYYLPEKFLWGNGLLFRLPEPYSLIREDAWNLFRDQVAKSDDDELKQLVLNSWLNPSQKRPEFARERSKNDTQGDFSAYPGK